MQSALCAAQPKTALQKKKKKEAICMHKLLGTPPKPNPKPLTRLEVLHKCRCLQMNADLSDVDIAVGPFWFARSLRLCFCSYLPLHSKTWPRQQRNTYSFRWPYRGTLPATLQTSQLKLEKEKFPLSRGDQLCTWLCVAISNTMLTADYSQGVGPVEE